VGVRRAGLSLLSAMPGLAKPVTGIEDVCVRPRDLPAYVAGLQEILARLGLSASFYGHVASGELHVRPVLDLHRAEDVARLRRVATRSRTSAGASAARWPPSTARHRAHRVPRGTGRSRARRATAAIKRLFDPAGVLNPGKVVDDGRYRIDRDLRLGPGSELVLPSPRPSARRPRPLLRRQPRAVQRLRRLPQGHAHHVPDFVATGEEIQSTRRRRTPSGPCSRAGWPAQPRFG